MLFHVAYPGLAICISLISRRPDFRGGGPTLLLLFLAAVLMFPWVIAARRGPMFPFMVVFIYSYYLMRPHLVNRAVVLGGLAFAGISMLLLVMVRDYSDTSATMKISEERLRRVTALDILTGKAYEESDNEFLYHCTYVGALLESQRFQWGTGYLSLATHWIPRAWWPEKPPLAHGWLDPLTKEEIYDVSGVYITTGASAGARPASQGCCGGSQEDAPARRESSVEEVETILATGPGSGAGSPRRVVGTRQTSVARTVMATIERRWALTPVGLRPPSVSAQQEGKKQGKGTLHFLQNEKLKRGHF